VITTGEQMQRETGNRQDGQKTITTGNPHDSISGIHTKPGGQKEDCVTV